MNPQEMNFVSELMQAGEDILNLRTRLQLLRSRYTLNAFDSSITDQELAETPTFAHLTQAELVSGVSAIDAVLNALGDNISGQATNLIRLKG